MSKKTFFVAALGIVAGTAVAHADTITDNVEVNAPAAKVWAAVGGFCSIDKWHPAIGSCTTDGKAEPTRTLTTKDGKGKFIEKQTERDDRGMMYSYEILKSPLPITNYNSTFKVVPRGANSSEVVWTSTFTSDKGQTEEADKAVDGIYKQGLDNIRSMLDAGK